MNPIWGKSFKLIIYIVFRCLLLHNHEYLISNHSIPHIYFQSVLYTQFQLYESFYIIGLFKVYSGWCIVKYVFNFVASISVFQFIPVQMIFSPYFISWKAPNSVNVQKSYLRRFNFNKDSSTDTYSLIFNLCAVCLILIDFSIIFKAYYMIFSESLCFYFCFIPVLH